MNQKVGINVAATADTSQVEQAINALGQKIAQANRVQFNPVGVKGIDDMKRLTTATQEYLKVADTLRRRLKDTNQMGRSVDQFDWDAMFPNKFAQANQMMMFGRRVLGDGAFSSLPQQPVQPPSAPAKPGGSGGGDGGGGGGGNGGGGGPGMGTRIVQAGLGAAGPVGGVAAGALGTGMSAGFGAGLMGLVGGLAALGVGKLVGAIAEKVGEAEKLSVDYDTLKRSLGDVGVEFKSLQSVLKNAAGQVSITYAEAGRLGAQFTKLSNLSGEQFKTVGDEIETGVGLSRSFGLDPSKGVGVLGQMRGMGITSNTQESRRFALLLGETIGKSGAFAKAEEVFDAIGGYATSQTRNSMGAANVAGYAGMYSAMAGSGIPGMDPAGAAGLLNKINSVLAAGGGKGEASQFFTGIVGHRMGLNPFQTQVLREGGAFATNSEAFGKDSAYGRYMGGAGPKGGTTFLQASLDELRNQYGGNKDMLAMATANHLGVGARQAMALLGIDPNQMGEMQGYAGDLTKMSSKGIGNLSKALYGSAGEREALRSDFLGRTGADAISAEDAASLRGASGDKELKAALATIAAKYDQERTTGSDIRDSKNALDNIKMDLASKLIPISQAMRDGILFMAGGGKKSRLEVMTEIEGVESESRQRGIGAEYESKLKTAGTSRFAARKAINDLAEKNRKAVASGEMTLEEHQRQMAPLMQREREAMEMDAKAREWNTQALEVERKLREKNIKALEESDAAERASKLPPAPAGSNESAAESARLARHGRAPTGGAASGRGYDPLSNAGARVTSGFGMRKHPISGDARHHDGIDFGAREGTAFNATADGEVVRSEMSKGGYGNVIEIRHADGSVTRYAHNQSNGVKVGQQVKAGQAIGKVGSTGRSTGPHLHYELRKNGRAVDPNAAFESGEHRRPIGSTPAGDLGAPAAQRPGDGQMMGGTASQEITVRLVDDKTGKPKADPIKVKVGAASPYGALRTGGVMGQ